MKASFKAIAIIKQFEGLKLTAYLCPAQVWTIGIGTTVYPSGMKVKQGDSCTVEQANDYLLNDLKKFERFIDIDLPQNKYDAVLSFIYNLGPGAWNGSTLKKKIVANQDDPAIRAEFLKWNKAGGKVLAGLTKRREAEADLYFS